MDNRFRNFATIVYPESVPKDWFDKLSEFKVPAYISPLHDKDVEITADSDTGEAKTILKKPHYHVLFFYEGKKSVDQVKDDFSQCFGQGYSGCEVIKSRRAQARYLCHLDNPDKYQYPISEVLSFGGLDYFAEISTSSDRYMTIAEMIDWCISTGTVSYCKLLAYARNERYDWFRILCDNGTIVMKEFLKSRAWELKKKKEEEGGSEGE